MDAWVLDLCDEIEALKAEIRRIRAAASHVIDKSCESSKEDFPDLGKALRKLQIELDRFAPSKVLDAPRKSRRR
jgi:formate-dependent phosphoribosylglycinamide formyltransferase (GAR transformylase)